MDLRRVVAAEAHRPQLVVAHVLDHAQQARVHAVEVLADVGAAGDRVLLVLAVDDLAHALRQQAVVVLRQQCVPLGAPQHLDHVPARAAEDRFELGDDLAVAADGAVEALQVAVDHEDQVVEPLARGQRDRAQRLRLVRLPVAEEDPYLRVRRLLEPAIDQVAHEARLVDPHQRSEAHRDGRELPEVLHQPGVGVRGQPAAFVELAAEIEQLLVAEPPLEVGAGVDARRGVALDVDQIAAARVVRAAEEVMEADLVERGRRGVGGDVAADALGAVVGLDDHRHRVPAHEALDALLEHAVARVGRLAAGRDRVHVGRARGHWQRRHRLLRLQLQILQQLGDTLRPAPEEDLVQRLPPLLALDRVEFGVERGARGLEVGAVAARCELAGGLGSVDRVDGHGVPPCPAGAAAVAWSAAW